MPLCVWQVWWLSRRCWVRSWSSSHSVQPPPTPTASSPSPFTSQSHTWTRGVRAVSSCSEHLCELSLGERWGELCHMYMLGNK